MPPEAAELLEDPTVLAVVTEDDEPQGAETATGQDNEPQANAEAERLASLMGWKPKDQWKGDDSKWRPAEEFLAEVPDILSNTRKKASRTQAQLDRVAGLVAKLEGNQRRQTDAQLDEALDAAVEAGDLEKAREIRKQIREASAQGSKTAGNPVVDAFKERNPWFEVNEEATAYAVLLDSQYSKNGVADQDAHMRRVEAGVRKAFPKLFEDEPEKPAEKTKPRAPLVGGGSSVPAAKAKPGEMTVADLTPAQRRAAEASDVSYEDYVKAVNKIAKQNEARR